MKKLLVFFVIIVICISLFVGCSAEARMENEWSGSGFTYIEKKGHVHYLYHNDTKVIYVFFEEYSGYSGGMTALLNPDGTPMIYEED